MGNQRLAVAQKENTERSEHGSIAVVRRMRRRGREMTLGPPVVGIAGRRVTAAALRCPDRMEKRAKPAAHPRHRLGRLRAYRRCGCAVAARGGSGGRSRREMGRRGRAPGLRATRVVGLGRRVEAAAETRVTPSPNAMSAPSQNGAGAAKRRVQPTAAAISRVHRTTLSVRS